MVGALVVDIRSPNTKGMTLDGVWPTGAEVTVTALLLLRVSKLTVCPGKLNSKLPPALTTDALICTSVLLMRTGLPP